MEAQNPQQTQTPQIPKDPTTDNGVPKGGWWFVAIFAVLVFISFGFYIGHMYIEAETWDHYVFIFNNIQTFVFAAGTFIFGREINRSSANANAKRATTAEKQKTAAEKKALDKAAEAQKHQERGQTLATMLRSQLTQNRTMSIKLGVLNEESESQEMNGFIELLDEWYPKK